VTRRGADLNRYVDGLTGEVMMQNALLNRLTKFLPLVICGCLLVLQAAEAEVNVSAGDGKQTSQTHISKHNIGALTIEDESTPLADISTRTVGMGRELYKGLRLAQEASGRHDEIATRLELSNASNVVDQLYNAAEVQVLRRQASRIREDLKRQGKHLNKALWLPLDAQLDQLRLLMPRQGFNVAKAALNKGRRAVKLDDKTQANIALDQIEEALTRRYALMPLGTIRSDLRSARSALDPYPPYWKGITEATGSALASIRWISTVHAKGWITAYLTAIEAGDEIPDHPLTARRLLRSTALSLPKENANDLYAMAENLSQKAHPSAKAVAKLIADIGERVAML
jgi:hypothetical protein